MIADLLPWLNILLVPVVGLLIGINSRLATLEESTRHIRGRLRKLDGIEV